MGNSTSDTIIKDKDIYYEDLNEHDRTEILSEFILIYTDTKFYKIDVEIYFSNSQLGYYQIKLVNKIIYFKYRYNLFEFVNTLKRPYTFNTVNKFDRQFKHNCVSHEIVFVYGLIGSTDNK